MAHRCGGDINITGAERSCLVVYHHPNNANPYYQRRFREIIRLYRNWWGGKHILYLGMRRVH